MNVEINDSVRSVVEYCLSIWGVDSNTENFLDKSTSWLTPVDQEQTDIFLKLLKSFNYYTRERVMTAFRELKVEFEQTVPYHEYTLYLPMISPKGRFNHSYDMISCYQTANNLGKEYFGTEIQEVINNYPLDKIVNIVFLDDVIGTGKTIKNSLEHYRKYYSKLLDDKSIYVMTLEACESGIEFISNYSKEINNQIRILTCNRHQKAFSVGYIFEGEEATAARNIIEGYEVKITNNKEDFILGFNRSEALMAFFYDTPNNTLCIFWHDNTKMNWTALFPRKRPKKAPWAKDIGSKTKMQRNVNYNISKIVGENSES
jgi:hypoxanthine phosphoribosyltransferase